MRERLVPHRAQKDHPSFLISCPLGRPMKRRIAVFPEPGPGRVETDVAPQGSVSLPVTVEALV